MSAWTSAVAALATQPLVWWRNDSGGTTETNLGSTGATGNGTVGVNVVTGAASLLVGDTDGAMTFDGVANSTGADGVYLADTTNMQPAGAFSISAIIKATAWSGTSGNTIVTYEGTSDISAYSFIVNTGGFLHGFIDVTASVHVNVISTTALSTGTVYFVVFTWDGATLKLYVNAARDPVTAANSASIIYTDLGAGVTLGAGGYGGASSGQFYGAFAGQIGHAMLWKNYALTQAEVLSLYNASALVPAAPSRSAYFDLTSRAPRVRTPPTLPYEVGPPLIITKASASVNGEQGNARFPDLRATLFRARRAVKKERTASARPRGLRNACELSSTPMARTTGWSRHRPSPV